MKGLGDEEAGLFTKIVQWMKKLVQEYF